MYLSSETRKNEFLYEIKKTNETLWIKLEKEVLWVNFWTEEFAIRTKKILAENRSPSSFINKIIADILRKNGIY